MADTALHDSNESSTRCHTHRAGLRRALYSLLYAVGQMMAQNTDTISRVEDLDMPRYVLTLLSDAHEANERRYLHFQQTLSQLEPIAIDSCASYSLTYERDDFIADTTKEVRIPIKGR